VGKASAGQQNDVHSEMTRKQTAGTGKASKVIQGGDIGATIVPTRPSDVDEDREGFTRKRFVTHVPAAKYGKGLAGDAAHSCLPMEDQ
jgi:hypothetical protein